MSDLLTYPGQPYPTVNPWIDLREHLEGSWEMGPASWHFRALIDGNTAELHLRTRRGTNRFLVPPDVLPLGVLPAGQEVIPAWEQRIGTIRMIFQPTGELYASDAADVADGSSPNLVVRYRYQRRAV